MIHLSNITKKFNKRGIAGLHEISFHVEKHEIIGLIGANGSGKSTLLKILDHKLEPDSGSIDHQSNILTFDPDLELNQDKMKVFDFLLQEVREDVKDEEKRIQLVRDFADLLEFTSQLYQKIEELSAGQKQKVLLTRSFFKKPDVLLLDEAFSHLDPQSKQEIFKLLFPLFKRENITIVWVHHDLNDVLKHSSKIMFLHFGRLEQFESVENILLKPKNIHVARYLNYSNFFPIKKIKDQIWQTPWGEIQLAEFNANEAFLVVPQSCWELGPQGIEMNVQFSHYQQEGKIYHLEHKGHIFTYLTSHLSQINQKSALFYPTFDKCFLIPL